MNEKMEFDQKIIEKNAQIICNMLAENFSTWLVNDYHHFSIHPILDYTSKSGDITFLLTGSSIEKLQAPLGISQTESQIERSENCNTFKINRNCVLRDIKKLFKEVVPQQRRIDDYKRNFDLHEIDFNRLNMMATEFMPILSLSMDKLNLLIQDLSNYFNTQNNKSNKVCELLKTNNPSIINDKIEVQGCKKTMELPQTKSNFFKVESTNDKIQKSIYIPPSQNNQL